MLWRRLALATLAIVPVLLAACAFAPPSARFETTTPSPTTVPGASQTAEAPPSVPRTEKGDLPALRLTIVYDNHPFDARLRSEWGFAAWIAYGERVVLFDTGGDGTVLLTNMRALDLDPAEIEAIVLSHNHGDHVGGLLSLLDTGIAPTVYAPTSLPAHLVGQVEARTSLVARPDVVEVVPGVHTTGELGGEIAEQALVLETPAGSVVVTGCAHPGIIPIVRRARDIAPGSVALLVGGFHLGQEPASGVAQLIDTLRSLEVIRTCPTHCTGDAAVAAFENAYGTGFVEGGVGRMIEITTSKDTH